MNVARPLKSADLDKTKEIDVEGNIRELVRRDSTGVREPNSEGELAADSLSSLLYRVSGNSAREIDNLIGELKGLRDKLQAEGSRVQRDIVEYSALSQSVMQLTKIIADGVTHVKKPDLPVALGSEHSPPISAAAQEL